MCRNCLALRRLAAACVLFSVLPVRGSDEPPPVPRPDPANTRTARVARILDMRTVVVREGEIERTLRILGVAEPRAEEARAAAAAFLTNLLAGEVVRIADDPDAPREEGGAFPAYLYREPDGLFVNLELVRQGYAGTAVRGEFAHRRLFQAYEARAREAGRGMWRVRPAASKEPVRRSDAPRADPGKGGAPVKVFVTRTGTKYHLADCPHLRKGGQEVTLEEARRKYSPCSHCKPPP